MSGLPEASMECLCVILRLTPPLPQIQWQDQAKDGGAEEGEGREETAQKHTSSNECSPERMQVRLVTMMMEKVNITTSIKKKKHLNKDVLVPMMIKVVNIVEGQDSTTVAQTSAGVVPAL